MSFVISPGILREGFLFAFVKINLVRRFCAEWRLESARRSPYSKQCCFSSLSPLRRAPTVTLESQEILQREIPDGATLLLAIT